MNGLSKKIENIFLAITFAEAGEAETAREFLRSEDRPSEYERIAASARPRKELKAPGARKR
jgi:hypothetical protein